MAANSNTSHVTLKHDFNEIPVYVSVNGRTDAGFIFPAFGSAQQDDDTSMTYGGIVFFYNETHIDILVSADNNYGSEKQWAAIYTGCLSFLKFYNSMNFWNNRFKTQNMISSIPLF